MNALTPDEKEVGKANFYTALAAFDGAEGPSFGRRDFLKGVVGAGAVSGAGLGAMWFGYDQKLADPVRIGVIGTGDEGNVLIGACNPDYVDVVAIADIRPSSIHRAFHGDYASPAAWAARRGLMDVYGYNSEDEAREHVKVYEDYKELLNDSDVEAVIIALPLHLHARVAVEAMGKGLHVLTEKLMAHDIAQCKVMSRVAEIQDLLLATGHQRHYNILYDNAVNMLRWGVLGQVHHIRAQWHRGNLPGKDSWAQPIPGGEPGISKDGKKITIDPIKAKREAWERTLARTTGSSEIDLLKKKIAQWKAWEKDAKVNASAFDYESAQIGGRERTALEELVRWRLWDRTGGGLMAELGSHQLDAASIFISALRKQSEDTAGSSRNKMTPVHPLTVRAIGGRHIFPQDRDSDDHVYCSFEFPGPEYDADFDLGYYDPATGFPRKGVEPYDQNKNRKVVVSYSSINGNGFGGYGEVIMGTKGTMVLEKEKEVMLYKNSDTATKVGMKGGSGGPTMDTQESGPPAAVAAAAVDSGPVSRGYTEQIEHWAWCIRNRAPENLPRCRPEVAVADAVLALTAKHAMGPENETGYVKFDSKWFDIDSNATPDGSKCEEIAKKFEVPEAGKAKKA